MDWFDYVFVFPSQPQKSLCFHFPPLAHEEREEYKRSRKRKNINRWLKRMRKNTTESAGEAPVLLAKSKKLEVDLGTCHTLHLNVINQLLMF